MLQCSIWLEPSYHSPSSPFNWTILLTTLLFLTIAWKHLVFLSTERPNYSWLSNPTYSLPFASTPLVAQNPFSSPLWVCLFLKKKKKKKNSSSCSLICCSLHTSSFFHCFFFEKAYILFIAYVCLNSLQIISLLGNGFVNLSKNSLIQLFHSVNLFLTSFSFPNNWKA